MRVFSVAALILFLSQVGIAQVVPASTPLADPADTRFQGVTEDFNSPSLSTSHLIPATPLIMLDEHDDYTVDLIRVQWRWGDPIDLYVMKPKAIKKPPVVLFLYGYPADTDIFKNEAFQEMVTRNGFAAVGFVSALTGHRYHDRPMREWFVSELQECLAVSAHDVQMVLDYLASRGDLDMSRLGMFTTGSGSSIGILASAVDSRIKVLDTLDPWGDWPTWMATSPFVPEEERADFVKTEFLKKVALLEPADWMSKIQARHFRLQQTTFGTVTPQACQKRLQTAIPKGTTLALYKTEVELNQAFAGHNALQWIQNQLRSLPESPAISAAPVK